MMKKRFYEPNVRRQYGLMDIALRSIVNQAKEDFELLMNGDSIDKNEQTQCKVNEGIISEAVYFILHK